MMQNNLMDDERVVTIEEIINDEQEKQLERERFALSKKYAVLDRVNEKAKRRNVTIPPQVLEEIGRMVLEVKGSVAVTTRQVDNPIVVECGDKIMEYRLDETLEGEKTSKPYILSLWFITPENGNGKSAKTIRFEKWLLGKGVPFASEIACKVDHEKDVTVHVYKYVKDFAIAVSAQSEIIDSDFVGQNVRNRAFSPKLAVGVVKNNQVYVYAPAWMFNKSDWEFYSRK